MYDETTRQREMLIKQGDEIIAIELDCYIADLIVALNNKQFYTEYCCSGHMEDAFMGFYIKFYPMDSVYEWIIRAFVSSISDLYIEDNYTLSTTIDISSNYIQLVDPTPEELAMAKQLVFREMVSEEEMKQWISHSITIRPKFVNEYMTSDCYDFDTMAEINKKKVFDAIARLEMLTNSFKVFSEPLD